MKKTVALLAVAGLAGTASANSFIIDAPSEVQPGETFDVMITLDLDPDPVAKSETGVQGLAASIFSLGNKAGSAGFTIDGWDIFDDWTLLTGDLTNQVDDQNISNVNIGQLTMFGLPFTQEDPLKFMTITITAGQDLGSIEIGTLTDAFQVWEGILDMNGDGNTNDQDVTAVEVSVTEGMASIAIVPTPASAALLGLGGLVAMRRRR